jgi:tryptophan synthase alpha chain
MNNVNESETKNTNKKDNNNMENTNIGNRYSASFSKLKEKNEGAFIPFVVIGDPNAEQSFAVIKALIDAGADALELGIPFSDPSADGVTIQMAALRALKSGINTDICIDILAQVRDYAPHIPIGLLLYGNLVFSRGLDNFYHDVASAGVDSVLIADLPIRESAPFREAALKHGIAPIFIAPPNGSEKTLIDVSNYSKGYTYVLSRAGVTGVDTPTGEINQASPSARQLIDTLTEYQAAPPVLGFGISNPEQVRDALAAGAAGAISGSAVVKIIESNIANSSEMLKQLTTFVTAMKTATKK